jgi:hypothetical protein
VLVPEFVPKWWWQQLLHNQPIFLLKAALLYRPGIVVTSVPYHLRQDRCYGQLRVVHDRADEKTLGIVTLEDMFVSFGGDVREAKPSGIRPLSVPMTD